MTTEQPRNSKLSDLVDRLELGLPDHDELSGPELERAASTLSEVLARPKNDQRRGPVRAGYRPLAVGLVVAAVLILAGVFVRGQLLHRPGSSVASPTPVVSAGSATPVHPVLRSLAAAASASPDSDARSVLVSTWSVGDAVARTYRRQLLSQASVRSTAGRWQRTSSGFLISWTAGSSADAGSESSAPDSGAIEPPPPDTPSLVRSYLAGAAGCEPTSASCLLSGIETFSLRQELPPRARKLMWQALGEHAGRLQGRGTVLDRAGRTAVAVGTVSGETETVVFADPVTGRFLGRDTVRKGVLVSFLTVLSDASGTSSQESAAPLA